MAAGDLTFFEEALAYLTNGSWSTTDDIKVAILDNTTTPTAADTTPALGDYTEVGTAGTYTAGSTSIGTLTSCISESGGTMTFDSTTNPSWAANGSNDTDAYWALVYNDTDGTDRALAFVDLGGPFNMATTTLTITWNASGLFTIS